MSEEKQRIKINADVYWAQLNKLTICQESIKSTCVTYLIKQRQL